jgi:hypothetical protein
VTGIGERDGDAAAHAASAETGDIGAMGHRSESIAKQRLQFSFAEIVEPQRLEGPAALRKILAADCAADR